MTKNIVSRFKFLKNKYSRWHDAIINRAKTRKLDDYTERHHIVPRSLGGGNENANLVDLTFREHFLIHHLLTKMTEGIALQKMLTALGWICDGHGGGKTLKRKRGFIPAWKYDLARRAAREAQLGRKRPGLHTEGFKIALSARLQNNQYRKGKKQKPSPETIAKQKAAWTKERRAESSARMQGNNLGSKVVWTEAMRDEARLRFIASGTQSKAVRQLKGKPRPDVSARLKGKPRPDVSIRLKNKPRDPEAVAKGAKNNTGKKRSPEFCAAVSARAKGRKNPKLSAKLKGRKCPWVAEANKRRASQPDNHPE